MRVVADTNIFFSALRAAPNPDAESNPGALLLRGALGHFTLVSSEAILAELEEVLLRKLGWEPSRLAAALQRIRTVAEIIHPRTSVADCVDPDDNHILEAAIDGNAAMIVTGDRDLLCMNPYRGIEICTVRDFLVRLDQTNTRA